MNRMVAVWGKIRSDGVGDRPVSIHKRVEKEAVQG